MANDATKVAIDCDRFSMSLNLAVEDVVRTIAFKVHGKLINKTPRDTGTAQAAWLVKVNGPSRRILPRRKYAKPEAKIVRVKAGDAVWISNNMPYIGALENGHSKQAPHGMVKLTEVEMKQEMRAIETAALRARGLT